MPIKYLINYNEFFTTMQFPESCMTETFARTGKNQNVLQVLLKPCINYPPWDSVTFTSMEFAMDSETGMCTISWQKNTQQKAQNSVDNGLSVISPAKTQFIVIL